MRNMLKLAAFAAGLTLAGAPDAATIYRATLVAPSPVGTVASPETAASLISWALMIAGFGIAGMAIRWRRWVFRA
ncbi:MULTISPECIES: hypothetical protein [unclassified Phenylobacterium]|uniref:hypothetical protein n=1 Tax=unclassified Phenylobacterium TaxID=2640670 RepID=UPI000AF24002|nr:MULTISPECIES: hypothetical protein [unclassified Phenylobacterium]